METILLDGSFFSKILNLKAFDNIDFWTFIVKFSLNFIINFIIIRYIYYRANNKKNYLFSFLLISIVVFLLCFMLSNVKLELGFAIGIFAIFGIIRYRTQQIPIKEMTYLFVIIGVSVINSLNNEKISFVEILVSNFIILSVVWILERVWLVKYGVSKKVLYEKIENIKPENYEILKQDLEQRTGLKIKRVEVKGVNFLKDVASVVIFYDDNENIK